MSNFGNGLAIDRMQNIPLAKDASLQHGVLVQYVVPFLIGGTSGMIATTCVQPLDMIKVRLQLATGTEVAGGGRISSINIVKGILSNGRFLDLYSGLSAALARQAVYGTFRLGFFVKFEHILKERAISQGNTYSFSQRAVASICAGGLAAAIGNPTEVALIRMQSDGMLPRQQRQNFKSVFDALIRVSKQERIFALWNGCSATVIRAMSTNFGQLAFFSESKHQLSVHTRLSDRAQTLVASAVGGFCAAIFSMPFDTVKSRLQSSQARYRGMLHCFSQILNLEGPLRFYRGFPAYFMRMAPHSVISLVIMDVLRKWLSPRVL